MSDNKPNEPKKPAINIPKPKFPTPPRQTKGPSNNNSIKVMRKAAARGR